MTREFLESLWVCFLGDFVLWWSVGWSRGGGHPPAETDASGWRHVGTIEYTLSRRVSMEIVASIVVSTINPMGDMKGYSLCRLL